MQANIIKDVIDKIISINKDLNEESLVNLLIASGWDKGDVELGKDFFYRSQSIASNREREVSVYQSTLPTVTDKINDNTLAINTFIKPMPAMYNMYEHAIENFNTKSLGIKTTLSSTENKTLYAWLNIGVLIILLIILASYIMSFNWR